MAKMGHFLTLSVHIHNAVDVGSSQFIIIGDLHKLLGSVDKEHLVILLALAQHHDAGGNGGTVKEVGRQLDDAIHKVVIHQVLANLLLRTTPIHNAREANDGRRTIGCQPRQAVHNKGHIRFALGRQHSCRGKARVVNQDRVVIPRPFNGIGRVRDYELKRLLAPMLGTGQCIIAGNIKFIKANFVQKHVDTAQVVGGDIHLLAIKTVTHRVLA